jgi:hypothetical protein
VKFAVKPTFPILLGVLVLAFAPSALAAGTVTVGVQGQGSATGTGIDCTQSGGPDCSEFYANNEYQECDPELKPPCRTVSEPPFVTFTAGPDSNGFAFSGWTGCDSTSGTGGRTCDLTVVDDKALTATFIDVQAPTMGSPSPPSGLQRGNITLSAAPSDNAGVTKVEFRVRGALVASDTSAPFSAQFNTASVADGTATIRATAFDARNNVSSAESTVTIDNSAPTLGVNGPDGQTFGAGTTQNWTISASDTNGVATIQCSVVPTGDAPIFGACSGGSTAHSVSGKPDGSYTLTVRATDNAGNQALQSRTFTVASGGTGDGGPGGTGDGGPGGGTPGEAVTDAQIAGRLGLDLAAAAKKLGAQRQAKLARKGSVGLVFSSLVAGKLTLTFKGASSKKRAARSVTIAKGSRAVTGAGRYTVTLKLTRAGKRLLRSGRIVKGKLAAVFTKASGGSVAATKGTTLKRR